ncbi:hypothetical protein DQ04_00021280 [Trypanosoma grayi]|uniref:hypothetical protein n=1 Tax=Trypanosoma grayi TaxID=71804 RepID=UPI0004F47601|nr:hypothetical protein DQ04_00021280 [Trypanosoma grayi]KEG15630.1 hypothetical protein DQ04_00021280 [Trypanosoma grayi]
MPTNPSHHHHHQEHQEAASSPQQPQPPEYGEYMMHGAYYGSPAPIGSLGTPNMGIRMAHRGSPGGSYGSRRSTRRSTPHSCYANEGQEGHHNMILVATRPLLKALARECRPCPPWCVGTLVCEEAMDELKQFAAFLRPTPEELSCSESAVGLATGIMQAVWPLVKMSPMSTTAAGLSPLKDVTLHYYAENTPVAPDDLESIQLRLQSVANDQGAQVEFSTDYRDVTCVVMTDARSGKRLTIRYGPRASHAGVAARIFQTTIASNEEYHATLTVLDALLRQNKILDDVGTNMEAVNGEALTTMLVAIINSYGLNDAPDAGRLMMDFFLTFGFPANFDLVKNSVTVKGMAVNPPSKVHRNAQISILDPFDEAQNLTPKLEKAAHLQAVFNYCYTALSQYKQVSQRQRRAQSILSTIIGGEAYWGRVLQLYHEGISPFVEVVNEKKHLLAHAL